ncbi:Uncharacterised protein [Clostridium tetani]|nr:hypothetical protein [Clostridium tetani]WFN61270.1 hypothetical protein PAA20_10085 [Clostridium tetani]SUY56751.1 Uncharacterised protein [Clostridium tetani]BDR67721.1 hypothetical protein K144312032_19490 [Clostridium tetani]BDR73123.1 hypothetical protein K144316041_18310 [Clostridium tetani]BDR78885.1 hypothetical protein K154307017_18180 [Clostridium tetani]
MKEFLDNKITQEEYYELMEKCYSEHGDLLKKCYANFNEKFMEVVPDACLYYIDEPGLEDSIKRALFRNEIISLYKILIEL